MAIQVTNLRLKFPGEEGLVFRDLSLFIPAEQKVLLLGPSGCGKSTLLQVLSGIIPHSLEVPHKADAIDVPKSWGFVFQDPDTQFCMPYVDEELAFVLENLRVPREQMDERIRRALHSVGLELDNPHTLIQNLSQGMKQRLALASVLLLEPEVLFLDEPTALLDPEGTAKIWQAVKRTAAHKTVVIVEHKIDHIMDWIDRVILFNTSGEILADGPPQYVFHRHRSELRSYGIWHPEVWDDYVRSETYRNIIADRERHEGARCQLVAQLEHFSGYHGKKEKIRVSKVEVCSGDWITVIGKNGAGKTTLLLSLMQLLRTSGCYVLHEKTVQWSKKNKTLPSGLTLVFQNPELQFVANTIFDEIAFSLRVQKQPESFTVLRVRELMSAFQLNVGDTRHPYQLSVGQKRRLSVAAAVVQDQQLLLLDEPTFGQDARNTFAILEMLEQLRRKGRRS